MYEEKMRGIAPYRAQLIIKTAADLTERLVTGKNLYNPTYRECEIVVELVMENLQKCGETYRRE